MTLAILAACSPGEVRIAVTRDATLIDFAIWRPGSPDGVGDLHRGRITARVPAMGGAFVALDGADGFLPDTEGAAGATAGTAWRADHARRAGRQGSTPDRFPRRPGAGFGRPRPPRADPPGPGPLRTSPRCIPRLPCGSTMPAWLRRLRPLLGTRITLYAPRSTRSWPGVSTGWPTPRRTCQEGRACRSIRRRR